ncbi:SPFH domain-containing protein [Anaerobaca lacustris]|uniref:SPFH domain-containing protein n=1 Tax=Anaerobaca lacustris TaxID=3044600 RepID=A0AAW6U3L7_9BACT|nr:SPFH domain-containing protein [Sedimentisphaerales bacterium M17dextr]
MGLFDKIRGEFIDIIEWTDSSADTIVYRFGRHDNEIKMGARLTVREAQKAIFVNKGQIADVFEPGMYTLETDNLPILSTLMGWRHGFHSPFKAEVYFINMRRFTDLKWGTKHPITLRDAEFGPVRLRAFGTYVMRVRDPQVLLREIVGTDGHFTTGEITDQLRNLIVSRFADILAESKIPVLDLAANYEELGQFVTERIKQEFANYGLELTTMLVENISLPPTVEEALDKRTSMGAIGDLHKYTQFQAANAMEEAAKNPSGMAGGGMGMGMGFAMANQMGQAMADQGTAPPPLPQSGPFYAALEGQQAGPFDLAAMQQHIESGRLTPQTLVWRKGMAGWVAAEHVKELKRLFDGPPPLP